MEFEERFFKRKKPNGPKLLAYGFTEAGGGYRYETDLMEGDFRLAVILDASGRVETRITEADTGEPYTLYKVADASGSFVGQLRGDCENLLVQIAQQCFEPDVFQSAQTKALIGYVRDRYQDELEFLWERSPDSAIWRRKDTGKWYGAVLTVSKSKLGLPSAERAEILDLRLPPGQMSALVDGQRYFPGWHMNKKHWYTILLDGSVPTEELAERIGESYRLALK